MTPSGTYATKFQFSFESDNGNIFLINIKKQNYTGSIINRPLGSSPILKRDTSDGGICGTSLELYAECQVDNEYVELYTSSARTFLVTLEKKRGSSYDVIWSGFIVPELYSAPDIAPPYDVQIIATDGIGELKNYPFAGNGRVQLAATVKSIMSNIGQTLANDDIVMLSRLKALSESIGYTRLLSDVYVDLDYLDGKSCYEVLQAIMQTLNARITFNNNIWYIIRETDMVEAGGVLSFYDLSGSQFPITPTVFGTMASYDYWPVGQLTTQVIPAKNRVSAAQEYHTRKSLFDNPDLEDNTSWTYTGDQAGITWLNIAPSGSGQRPRLYAPANVASKLTQSLSLAQYQEDLTLSVGLRAASGMTAHAHFVLKLTSGGTSYYLTQSGDDVIWSTTSYAFDIELFYSASQYLSAYQNINLTVPPMPGAGTMEFSIWSSPDDATPVPGGNIFMVGWVYLTQNAVAGLRNNVVIDNGAREEGDELPLAFGGEPGSYANTLKALYGIMTKSNGTVLTNWETNRLTTAAPYLQLMALDYALTNAQTRLRETGTLNVPLFSGQPALPLIYKDSSGLPYLLEQMSWKLLDDEVEVSLVSRPDAASLTVTSSTISEIIEPVSSGTSSGGSGGSGSGGTTDYNALSNKPSINSVQLQGDHSGESLELIDFSVIEYNSGDDSITIKYPTRVNVADPEDPAVYRWLTALLKQFYVTQGNFTVDGSLIPTSYRDLGSQGHEFADGYIDNLWPEKIEFSDGSKIYEYASQLRLYGEAGAIIEDATNQSSLNYGNGEFVSTESDNLGSWAEPWGEVWGSAFYCSYDIVDGSRWPIGFRWNNTAGYFELIGPTYFYGGEFLPMGAYQGNSVTKTLGNMYFFWDYAFTRNVIFDRTANGINRGLSWDSGNGYIGCNVDINFTGNVYINGQPVSASDERLKENVEALSDVEAAKILSALKAVNFVWKESGNKGHGFIAQDVAEILPDIVHKRGDGMLGLDYISLIAYLVKGWQEQERRINELELLVKQLMDKIK